LNSNGVSGHTRRTEDLIRRGLLEIGDGYRAKNDELGRSGIPFARAGNIAGGFNFQEADCFPEDNLARVGAKVARPGDVVFTSKGTVGRLAFVTDDTGAFVYSPQLCYWRSKDVNTIDPRACYELGRLGGWKHNHPASRTRPM